MSPDPGGRGHRVVAIEIAPAKDEEAAITSDDTVESVLIVVVPQVRQRRPRIVDRVEPIKDVRHVRHFHD